MDAMEDLGYYTHSMTEYCIDANPPKKPVCRKDGNIIVCEPQKPKFGYEEYTFSNVEPEGFKECMEYWKFLVSKHRKDLIDALKRKTI